MHAYNYYVTDMLTQYIDLYQQRHILNICTRYTRKAYHRVTYRNL